MISTSRLLAQGFGSFRPPSETYNQNANTNEGALGNLTTFISTMIGVITVGAGLFFIVNFLIAAINWITAGGDSSKISSASNKMIQSVIGLIIVVAAYAIIGIVGTIVGLDILNPAKTLETIIPN